MIPKLRDYLAGYNPELHNVVAKTSCRRCYGRGILGRDTVTDKPVQCTCLRLALKETEPLLNPTLQDFAPQQKETEDGRAEEAGVVESVPSSDSSKEDRQSISS